MLSKLTIKQAQAGLRNNKFTSVELTESCLARIKERNPQINAFITVCEKSALAEAKKADIMIAGGKAAALTGIPFGVKDAICTKDIRSTGAGKILDSYISPYEATVIARIRAQGAVLVGKQNCDTFGHGASNENSMYGNVKNPLDLTKVAGGSSGGSAAAVADDQCLFSIGEDTGGSVRLPASFCGLCGLRPSYGRNSRFGVMPMASSLDTVGPIARTTEDIAIIMQVIAGRDDKDATTVANPVPDYVKEINKEVKNIKIGIPKEYFELKGMDKEVKTIIENRIKGMERMGYKITEVSLPHTKYAIPVYYIIVPSEDSSNLGRLDGIRYGVREYEEGLYDTYAKSRANGFPEEVKRRIIIGTYALSAGYYDAYYRKAQKVRTLIKQDFENVFKKVDALVTPTAPYPAFAIGAKKDDILAMYLADVFEVPASLAGVPALSLPAGNTEAGLPVGLQVIGPRLKEETVLMVGNNIEKNIKL